MTATCFARSMRRPSSPSPTRRPTPSPRWRRTGWPRTATRRGRADEGGPMTDPTIDRRLLIGGIALAGVASAAAAQAQLAAAPQAFTPQPLPFDPKAVPGLSEKLLVSHHD